MNRSVVVLLVSLAACSGPARLAPPTPVPDSATTADDVLARLPTPDSLWTTLRIRAQLAFSAPDGGGSYASEILARREDSILVRLRLPLGIEAARVLITPDSVLFLDRVNGRLYSGNRASGLLPAGLHADDLTAAFFGFDVPTRGHWELTRDSTLLRLERGNAIETILVDPARWRMVARDLRTGDGTLLESRRYMDFESYDGLVLPRRIITMRPLEDSRASFTVRSVERVTEDVSFGLGIPPAIRRIRVY